MRPAALIERLDLRRPIFKRTAAYGHFGRTDGGEGFTWENTDPYAAQLRWAESAQTPPSAGVIGAIADRGATMKNGAGVTSAANCRRRP